MTDELDKVKMTKRVSFTPGDQTPTVQVDPEIADQEETSTEEMAGMLPQEIGEPGTMDIRTMSPVPPPGFQPFEWPQLERNNSVDVNRDPGLKFVASWSAKIAEEEMSPPPLEPLSPIPVENSQDSIAVQVGTTDSETYTPIVLDRIRSVHRRRSRRPVNMHPTYEELAPAEDFLFRDIVCEDALITKRSSSKPTGNRDRGKVPQWRLAREGPFPNERSQASLRVLGKGCAFRHTTYSAEDHARLEGGLGVPLNHPRFLEWLAAPDSAWFLEMSPGHWCDTLSRDQAMTAAMQLQYKSRLSS